MKEMKTLTMPNGVTYEIVDDKARKDIANIDTMNKRDCVAPIVSTADGESIVITDSSDRPVRNLRMFGKTTQNTTTGAQLLDFSAMKMDSGGTTVAEIKNDGRTVTITGTKAYAMGYIDVDVTAYVGETLYLTGTKSGGNTPSLMARLIKADNTKTYVSALTTGYTVLPDDNTISLQFIANNTATALSVATTATFSEVMLSNVKDAIWEPYTGGIAAPNLSYTRDLVNVENPVVTVKGGNLIPVNYADGKSKTMNGVTFEVQPDGSIIVNGTATETAYFSFNNTGNKIQIPNGWLSTSSGVGFGSGIPQIQNDIYVDGEYVTSVQTVLESSSRNQFFGNVELGASRVKVDAGVTVVSKRIYPMLCASITPFEYEPPKQPQTITIDRTLRSVGDICDEIDFERGVFVQRTISRRLLHSDSWAAMEDEGRYWLLEDAFYNVSANAYCTHFSKASSWLSHTLSDGTFIVYRDPFWNDGRMSFKDSKFDNLDKWKQFLENNTVEVVYQLATPIETPLTEEELAAFNALYTYKPNTTVLNNKGAGMEIEYNVDLQTSISPEKLKEKLNLGSGSGSGGNADLTGYATEQYVKDYAQPKGEYLTAVPEGYAKTEDIPTKPEDIGAQPSGNYLTEVPSGYATEEFVKNKIAEAALEGNDVDLSGYAKKSELPTKVSQLQNDSGYLTEHQDISGKLDASALPTAINTALAQAKSSGEFDGKDGVDGKDGQDGYTPQKNIDYFDGQPGEKGDKGDKGDPGEKGDTGAPGADGANGKDGTSATHSWNGTVLTISSASGTSSADLKGAKGDKGDKGDAGATGAQGEPGKDGADGKDGSNGKDGVSATHSWNGTTLTITSASGTSSANLKGEKGDKGDQGIQGEPGAKGDTGATGPKGDAGSKGDAGATGQRGTGLLSVTTAPSGYTTAVGGITPTYRMAISTIKTQAGVTEVLLGDTIRYSYYYYPIAYLDSSYAYCTTRVSLRGASGEAGADGLPGTPGSDGVDGYTPVKGVDYYTEVEKSEWEAYIATELAKRGQLKPEFANSIEECTDTTKLYVLPDGYIYAYMLTEVEDKPSYTNVLKTAQTSVTDASVFNGSGYEVDKCFKTSGDVEDASSFSTQQTGGKNLITGFIPITLSDNIYFDKAYIYKFSTTRFACWFYDANGSRLMYISPQTLNNGVWESAATMGANNNVICLDMSVLSTIYNSGSSDLTYAKYVRFSLQTDGSDPSEAVITINEPITEGGGTTTEYAFSSTGIQFVSMDSVNALNEQTADHEERIAILEEQTNAVRIIAPPKLTVLAGHELNVYTDNMILCDNIKNYEVRWSFTGDLNGKAIAMEDCLRFPSTIARAMTDIATLRVREKATGTLIASAQIPVEIIVEPSLSGKNVIFIGDSLTEATYYPAEIQNNLSGGGITSLGTRSNYIYINEVGMRVPHEGRSGWSVANYLSAESYNGATNAFYNPDSGAFDFSYYMDQQGYSAADAVCIGLGTNGVTAIESNVSGINAMIDSIHAYNSSIKVFVALVTPPALQDGWRNIQNTDEWKRQQLALVEAYITAFANRTDNVDVIPWYVAISREFDFPRIEVAESARNPIVVTRANNSVHPSVYGYLKMADMLYNILASEFV